MTENALSILIVIFSQLQQTEISERKLFIFHLGAIAVVSASSADIVASNDDCFMIFHNVLSVSCFTSGSLCYTMFYYV